MADPIGFAKITHRGVFIERQIHRDPGNPQSYYKWICHTGISKFLPDLYDSQRLAIEAVDAKFAANPK